MISHMDVSDIMHGPPEEDAHKEVEINHGEEEADSKLITEAGKKGTTLETLKSDDGSEEQSNFVERTEDIAPQRSSTISRGLRKAIVRRAFGEDTNASPHSECGSICASFLSINNPTTVKYVTAKTEETLSEAGVKREEQIRFRKILKQHEIQAEGVERIGQPKETVEAPEHSKKSLLHHVREGKEPLNGLNVFSCGQEGYHIQDPIALTDHYSIGELKNQLASDSKKINGALPIDAVLKNKERENEHPGRPHRSWSSTSQKRSSTSTIGENSDYTHQRWGSSGFSNRNRLKLHFTSAEEQELEKEQLEISDISVRKKEYQTFLEAKTSALETENASTDLTENIPRQKKVTLIVNQGTPGGDESYAESGEIAKDFSEKQKEGKSELESLRSEEASYKSSSSDSGNHSLSGQENRTVLHSRVAEFEQRVPHLAKNECLQDSHYEAQKAPKSRNKKYQGKGKVSPGNQLIGLDTTTCKLPTISETAPTALEASSDEKLIDESCSTEEKPHRHSGDLGEKSLDMPSKEIGDKQDKIPSSKDEKQQNQNSELLLKSLGQQNEIRTERKDPPRRKAAKKNIVKDSKRGIAANDKVAHIENVDERLGEIENSFPTEGDLNFKKSYPFQVRRYEIPQDEISNTLLTLRYKAKLIRIKQKNLLSYIELLHLSDIMKDDISSLREENDKNEDMKL